MNHLNLQDLRVSLYDFLFDFAFAFPTKFLLNLYLNYRHVDFLNHVKKNKILLFNLKLDYFFQNHLFAQFAYPLIFKCLHQQSIFDSLKIYSEVLL